MDLREQLLKAGLITEQQVKTVEKDEHQQTKARGHRAVRAEKDAQRERREAEDAARRSADRERERARRSDEEQRDLDNRITQLARANRQKDPGRSNRRWYFSGRNGRLPYMMVGNDLGAALEKGRAAIVQSPAGEAWAVDHETAARIDELDDLWLRCWRRRS